MRNQLAIKILTHLCCIKLFLLFVGGEQGFVGGKQVAANDSLPNIVLIVVDDLGYGELGCQGNPEIPTPHIDRIAAGGIRFTQGYVTASYCSQSRAGLLTGRHQSRFGYLTNPIGAQNDEPGVGLPLSEKTLASYLRDSGYVTGLIGKWHLGASSGYLPMRRGFDEFYGFLHEGHYYSQSPYEGLTSWIRRKTLPGGGDGVFYSEKRRTYYTKHMGYNEPIYDANNPIYKGGQPVEEKLYLTDAITREAKSFVARNSDGPFFLMVSYNAVHSPMQGTNAYFKKYSHIKDVQRRIFAAMLANLDDSVGEVLASLKEHSVEQDTLLFLLSDNGGPTRELTSSNLPLRGEKGSFYEGGVRVPFMVRWPASGITGGMTYDQPVSSLDIFATVQQIAGFKTQGNRVLDGVDLMPFLKKKKDGPPHRQLFWQSSRRLAMRSDNWKIVRDLKRNKSELFDLSKDIGEKQDLAESEPDKLNEMEQELELLQRKIVADN